MKRNRASQQKFAKFKGSDTLKFVCAGEVLERKFINEIVCFSSKRQTKKTEIHKIRQRFTILTPLIPRTRVKETASRKHQKSKKEMKQCKLILSALERQATPRHLHTIKEFVWTRSTLGVLSNRFADAHCLQCRC